MRFVLKAALCLILGFVVAEPARARACGGSYGAVSADPMPDALAIKGSAVSANGDGLYVAYPMRLTDSKQSLYGGTFEIKRDARFARLAKRLAKGESPRVVLGRAKAGDPWRVLQISRS